jgi:hypothetical protein
MAYNQEGNEKIDWGHSPIVKALVKACDGRLGLWPQMLLYAYGQTGQLSSVTGYMSCELMTRQAFVMPTKRAIATWTVLPWKQGMSREELLAIQIR